jgi:hypothetical protein
MADTSVHITSSDLPEWATEDTMQKLMESMEKLVGLTDKQKKDMESGFKDMKETGKVTRQNIKKAGAGGANIFGDTTSGLKSFGKELSETEATIDSLDKPLGAFNKGLSESAKRFGIIGGAFAVFGQQVGLAIGDIKETVGALQQMTDVGIQVKGGFQGLRQVMADTGMSLGEVQEITGKYTRTVGNVGLRGILDLTKAAEDGTFSFREYGMVVAEGAEFQAKMLESQRLGGIFRVQDERAQSMALQENIKNLTAYSNILNVSREEMAQQQIEMKSRADVMRRFNSMDDASREAANASFDQFSAIITALGPEAKGLGDMMTTIIADPAAVNSEAFKTLAAASPQAAQAILDLREKILSGEDVSQQDIVNSLLGPLDQAAKSGQLEMLSMSDALGETVNMLGGPVLNSLRNWEQRMADATGDTVEEKMQNLSQSTDGAVSAAVGLDQELRKLSQTITSSRIDVFMNLFGEEAAAGVQGITRAIAAVSDGIETAGNIDYRGAIESVIEKLGEFGSWLGLQIDTVFSNIANTLSSLWEGIKSIVDKIVKIPGMMWNAVVDAISFVTGGVISLDKVEVGNSGPEPAFPEGARLADVQSAESVVAGRQAGLEQAMAGGASADQIAMWQRMVELAEQNLNEIRRIRTAGPNALTDQ